MKCVCVCTARRSTLWLQAREVRSRRTGGQEVVPGLSIHCRYQVVDYTRECWGDVLEAHSVDVVYDCGVEPSAQNQDAQRVLKKADGCGRFVSLLPALEPPAASQLDAVNLELIMVHPPGVQLRVLAKYIDEKVVRAPIDYVCVRGALRRDPAARDRSRAREARAARR